MTSPAFEVLIIPVIWCAKEELRLGEIKQLAQGLIAGWSCVNLNSALSKGEELPTHHHTSARKQVVDFKLWT